MDSNHHLNAFKAFASSIELQGHCASGRSCTPTLRKHVFLKYACLLFHHRSVSAKKRICTFTPCKAHTFEVCASTIPPFSHPTAATAGLEPATLALTERHSAFELHGNIFKDPSPSLYLCHNIISKNCQNFFLLLYHSFRNCRIRHPQKLCNGKLNRNKQLFLSAPKLGHWIRYS